MIKPQFCLNLKAFFSKLSQRMEEVIVSNRCLIVKTSTANRHTLQHYFTVQIRVQAEEKKLSSVIPADILFARKPFTVAHLYS